MLSIIIAVIVITITVVYRLLWTRPIQYTENAESLRFGLAKPVCSLKRNS